jgi:hypothetical protein
MLDHNNIFNVPVWLFILIFSSRFLPAAVIGDGCLLGMRGSGNAHHYAPMTILDFDCTSYRFGKLNKIYDLFYENVSRAFSSFLQNYIFGFNHFRIQ